MRINRTYGISMGHFADASLIQSRDVFWNHYGGRTVQMTRQDTRALRRPQRGIKTQKGTSSEWTAHRLATTEQSPAGLDLEPARLKMAGRVSRNLTLKPTISGPDRESRDFDGNKQDFGEERNPPKPHATHETSPVLGAGVVGMTNRACHRPSYLPAGVPGISTAQR
jgi:hypothetical protein